MRSFMSKICITALSLRNYAGSERVIFELAQALKKQQYDITIACVDIGEFYFNEMPQYKIINQPSLIDDEYDIILNFHWPSFVTFFQNSSSSTRVIHFCLSPYEPLEFPVGHDKYIDLVLCNSKETLNSVSKKISCPADVFVNSLDPSVFSPLRNIDKLKRIAVISNHVPQEISDLRELFVKDGIEFEVVGHSTSNQRFVDAELLSEYDLVITIGYTVVMCMAAKIPVFVYDHFGGQGWITEDNINEISFYNYSGRPTNNKMSSEELYNEITKNFIPALDNLDLCYDWFSQHHDITSNLKKVLIHSTPPKPKNNSVELSTSAQAASFNKVLLSNRHLERELQSTTSQFSSIQEEQQVKINELVSNNVQLESNIVQLESNIMQLKNNIEQLESNTEQLKVYNREVEKQLDIEKNLSLASIIKRKIHSFWNNVKVNSRAIKYIMSLLSKVKFKLNIVLFLFKRFIFQVRNRGLKYTLGLVLKKKDQAMGMLFPKRVAVPKSNKESSIKSTSISEHARFEKGLVSVIIPIYDRTSELKEAIESILNQSYQNLELILVTDGSPQDTIDVVNEYLDDERVKVFYHPTSSGNAVRGRNKGLIEASGEYIAFLDSDDIALSNRIELCVNYLNENSDYAGVYGTWIPMLDGSREVNGVSHGQPVYSPDGGLREHIENCIPCQSTVMVRASAIRAVGGVNRKMKYREDHELWARLNANNFLLKSLQEPLVKLRLHQGNNELSFTEHDSHWNKVLLEQYNTKVVLPQKIVWVVAGLGISGGLAVILKHANNLLDKGYDVSLLTLSTGEEISWYDNNVPVYELSNCKPYVLDNIDVLIATAWNTESYLDQICSRRKLYFVQSDERRFIDGAEIKRTIEAGYSKDYEYFTEAYWIQDMFHSEFGKQAFYVPNGIDTNIFNTKKLFEPRTERKRVLIEGPIDIPFKAVEDCYNAVKDLDCDIWFVSSAGKPRNDWRYDQFFEKVPMHMMPSIYSSCDIFIKMSRIEGFFGPPLEAMACDCVPVVGKVSGWDEYIKDEYNALAVDLKDVESAKRAVQRLLESKELRGKLLENGKATVEQWSWKRSFERMELLISKGI